MDGDEINLPYSTELRITAEAKIQTANAMREEIKIKWAIIHQFEREARDLIKLARMEDNIEVQSN